MKLNKLFGFVAFGLAVVAVILALVGTGAQATVGPLTTKYSGAKLIFGEKDSNIQFNFLGFLGLLLLLVGGGLAAFLNKPVELFIAAGILVLGAVFMFVCKNTATVKILGETIKFVKDYDLGWGLIMAGVLGILAGGGALAKAFVKK